MSALPFDPKHFAERLGAWLSQGGPENDVVISCRVRLARNVQGYPFIPRLEPERASALADQLRAFLVAARIDQETWWIAMEQATPLLRLLLRERYLVSRDLAPTQGEHEAQPGRAVAFGHSEALAIMVNEEDHLRLQSLSGGWALDEAWQRIVDLDRRLEAEIPLAHSDKLGYLTSCPSNVGTGLRASVMLHLPALSLVRSELEKVFAAAHRTGLAVRGMYGEGSRAAGDLYQISNQVTLGRSEVQLLADMKSLVPYIIEFERRVRELLLKEQRPALVDRVSRAYGLLRTARAMETEAALSQLSMVRLGECLELVRGPSLPDLSRLTVQIQQGHIQALNAGAEPERMLEASERDRLRAGLLRRRFAVA